MDAIKINLPEFLIAGISVRTINNGQAGVDIKALWDKFYKEQIIEIIPGKLSGDIYCVYTDYETDYTGYYTAVLGCKVSSIAELPAGLTGIIIPASAYAVCESKGNLPHSVLTTWQQIWDSDINRAYKADFDVYTNNSWSGGSVLTYVGV